MEKPAYADALPSGEDGVLPRAAAAAMLAWFDLHKRDLPWRRTRDPYAIWVSEVMLQQTRVAAVLDHYARWMERFPDIAALAAAEEADVLTLWSGLGYYRRARMLHHAAQVVVAEHAGALPQTAAELQQLPGIGVYTSAAVASIAFGEAVPVVDGNVERVVTRVLGLAPPASTAKADDAPAAMPAPGELTRALQAGARALLAAGRAGDANQAMMELGATVCLPRAPLCLHCPLRPWCRTQGEHRAAARKALVAKEIAYALVENEGAVLLRQRDADASLMAGMWELPPLDFGADSAPADAKVVLRVRHAITVTNYAVSIVRFRSADGWTGTLRWCEVRELAHLPLTGLARKVLRRLGIWRVA